MIWRIVQQILLDNITIVLEGIGHRDNRRVIENGSFRSHAIPSPVDDTAFQYLKERFGWTKYWVSLAAGVYLSTCANHGRHPCLNIRQTIHRKTEPA
jgi:hypothetical protein